MELICTPTNWRLCGLNPCHCQALPRLDGLLPPHATELPLWHAVVQVLAGLTHSSLAISHQPAPPDLVPPTKQLSYCHPRFSATTPPWLLASARPALIRLSSDSGNRGANPAPGHTFVFAVRIHECLTQTSASSLVAHNCMQAFGSLIFCPTQTSICRCTALK